MSRKGKKVKRSRETSQVRITPAMTKAIENNQELYALREAVREEKEFGKSERERHRKKIESHRRRLKKMQNDLMRETLKVLCQKQEVMENRLNQSRSSGSSRKPSSARQQSSSRELSSARSESTSSVSIPSSSCQVASNSEPERPSLKPKTPILPSEAPKAVKLERIESKPVPAELHRPDPREISGGSSKLKQKSAKNSDNHLSGGGKKEVVKSEKPSTTEQERHETKPTIPNIKREVQRNMKVVNQPARERSFSPEIISEKPARVKRQADQPRQMIAQPSTDDEVSEPDDRFPDKTFVPVTEEAMARVMRRINRYQREKRCAAIVFNSCFYLDDIPLKVVLDKYTPLFGRIHPDQILVRVDIRKLTKTPEEAYKLGFKALNQAYIIGESGLDENNLNRKAAALEVFCCPMTLDCIKNNLKEGIYLMHRSVVLQSITDATVSDKGTEVAPGTGQQRATSGEQKEAERAKKTERIAAGKENVKPKIKKEPSQTPQVAPNPVENSAKPGRVDDQSWKRISACGKIVLMIENLPPKTTVHSLNLMMGTFFLKGHQMLAIKRPGQAGIEVMDMMIVTNDDNEDWKRVLEKDGSKTGLGLKLHIKRSHHGLLRKFMVNNSSNLIQLETSDKLPIKWIGYGNQSQ